jgi:2-isopropylmalate synthase
VQGCLNGYGERCGNANLASVIANLELKFGHTCIGREKLTEISAVCKLIAELANLPLRNDQPFVGKSAFAHKGGIHVSAVLKDPATYEHIPPDIVGNTRRVLVSDLAGRGNVAYKLKEHGLAERLDEHQRRELLDRIKQLEYEGYELEAAEGTFELLVREALEPGAHFFDVESYEVTTQSNAAGRSETTAVVRVKSEGAPYEASATGQGPFNALHICLRKCLSSVYPEIGDVRLTDYKVRVLDSNNGTAARVRVLIEWADHRGSWSTVGVSDNVIEASWQALVDAIRLELMRLRPAAHPADRPRDHVSS